MLHGSGGASAFVTSEQLQQTINELMSKHSSTEYGGDGGGGGINAEVRRGGLYMIHILIVHNLINTHSGHLLRQPFFKIESISDNFVGNDLSSVHTRFLFLMVLALLASISFVVSFNP